MGAENDRQASTALTEKERDLLRWAQGVEGIMVLNKETGEWEPLKDKK